MSVLVLSWDRVGERMAGSAIRTVELARALAAVTRHGRDRPDREAVIAAQHHRHGSS